MKTTISLAMLGLLLCVPATVAQAAELNIPFEEYRLDNGLQVLLSHDDATPVVHVELWYHVGSKDEVPGRSGFAHLFEHLMFNGSKHWDDEYFAPLSPLGARINGSTSTERTNYYETVPKNGLELALWLEADRMGFLLEALTVEKLDNQRDVVKNERRQNYENAPYGESRKVMAEAVWPEGHPYYHLTIGSHEDLTAATLDDVKAFFRAWYAPNNATITVVGDFDAAETKAWIERYFGPIARGPEPKPVTEAEAPLPAAQTIEMTDDVQLPRLTMVWRSPGFFAEGDADLDVLSSVLTSGKTSRLYKRLVFDDRIAKDVSAGQYSRQLGSTYNVVATVAPGHTVEEVQAAIEEELNLLLEEGVKESEIARSKNSWKKMFFGQLESVAGKAGALHRYNHHVGDPGFVDKDLQRYINVTKESVDRWAREVMVDDHRVIVVVQPEPEPPAESEATQEGGK